MMRIFRLSCRYTLYLILFPAIAFGNGFAINEQSARAAGMGGAFVAQADSPSAVYYNPAGITQLKETQISTGFGLFVPKASFESSVDDPIIKTHAGKTTDLEDTVYFAPNLFGTHKITSQWSTGIGIFSPFGLGTNWPDDWEGRYTIGGTETKLKSISINPVAAFRPGKRFSFSAGPILQYIDITLKNKQNLFPVSQIDADSKLEGDNWAWGLNAGLLFWISDNLKAGVSYRSRIIHKITGGKLIVTGIPAALGGNVITGASADLKLPSILSLGAAWSIRSLTMEFDAQWTEWSTYNTLKVIPDNGQIISTTTDWNNVWAYRFGSQYRLNEYLDLRGGIVFDESPIPDKTLGPLVPFGDRWLFSFGAGIHYQNFTVDIVYTYVDDEDRIWNNEAGNYNTLISSATGRVVGEFKDVNTHIFGINVSYRF